MGSHWESGCSGSKHRSGTDCGSINKAKGPRNGPVVRAHDSRLPVEHVIAHRSRTAVSGWVLGQIGEFLQDMKRCI